MVNYLEVSLDLIFHALGDPTRLAIVKQLVHQGEQTVSQLAAPHRISPPAISKHLRLLERAELILRRKAGRVHYITINREAIDSIHHWLEFHRNNYRKSKQS